MEHLLRCGREKKVSGLSPPRNLTFKKISKQLQDKFALTFCHYLLARKLCTITLIWTAQRWDVTIWNESFTCFNLKDLYFSRWHFSWWDAFQSHHFGLLMMRLFNHVETFHNEAMYDDKTLFNLSDSWWDSLVKFCCSKGTSVEVRRIVRHLQTWIWFSDQLFFYWNMIDCLQLFYGFFWQS